MRNCPNGLNLLSLLLSLAALLLPPISLTLLTLTPVFAAYTVCNNNHGCCNTDPASMQCTTSDGYRAQLITGSGPCSTNTSHSMQLDWQASGPTETICLVEAIQPNQYFQHSEVTCNSWNDQFQVVPVGTTFNPGTVTAAQVPLLALNNYQYCSSVHGCCQTTASSSGSLTCQVDDGQHIASITIKKNVSECHGQLHVEMDIGDNYFAACLQPEEGTGCASVFIHFSTCWGSPEVHRVCPPSCTMQPLDYYATLGTCPSSLLLAYNTSCSLVCDTGFVPSQNFTTCNTDGVLSQQVCERAPCQAPWPPPTQPLNGSAASCANTLKDMGTCSIQCQPGFVVFGDGYRCNQGVVTGGPQSCIPLPPGGGGGDDPSWPTPLLPMDDSLFANAPECLRTQEAPRVFFMYFGGLPDPMWVALMASSCTLLLSVLVNWISGALSEKDCTVRWQLRWIQSKIWCKRRCAYGRDAQYAFAEGEAVKQFLTLDGFYEGLDWGSLSDMLARPPSRVSALVAANHERSPHAPRPTFTTTSLFDICMRSSTHPHLPLPTPLEVSRNFDILYRRHQAVFGPWSLSSLRVFIFWCHLYILPMYEKYTWALIAGMLKVEDLQRIRSQVELAVKEQGWQADLDHQHTIERIRDLLSISPAVAVVQMGVQLIHVVITATSISTGGSTFQSICEVIFRVFHSGSVNLAATYALYLINLRLFGRDLSKFEIQQRGVGGSIQDEQDEERAAYSISVSAKPTSHVYRVEVPVREQLPSNWFYRVPKQIPMALKTLHMRLDKRIRQSALYLPFPKLSLACFIICIPVLIGFVLPMLLLYAPVFLALYTILYLFLLILAQLSFACLSDRRGSNSDDDGMSLYDPMHAVELQQQLLPQGVDPNSVVLPAAAMPSAAAASFDADYYGEELHLWQSVELNHVTPVNEEEVRRLDACYLITPPAAVMANPAKYVQGAAMPTAAAGVSAESSSSSSSRGYSYLSSLLDPTLPVRLPKQNGGSFNLVFNPKKETFDLDPRRFQHRIIGAPLSDWARDEDQSDAPARYQTNAFLVFHFFLARLVLSFAVVLTLQCTLDYALLTYTFGPFSPFTHWLPLLQFEFDAHSTSCYFDAVQALWRSALAFVSRF